MFVVHAQSTAVQEAQRHCGTIIPVCLEYVRSNNTGDPLPLKEGNESREGTTPHGVTNDPDSIDDRTAPKLIIHKEQHRPPMNHTGKP